MSETEKQVRAVDLTEALNEMEAQGTPPSGFHMMLFSPYFGMTEQCPVLQLLKMIGAEYNFTDTIKRQVFQLPKDRIIISYEFAWLGGFHDLQQVMESINDTLEDQFTRMVDNKVLKEKPQARISFLAALTEGGEEE